MAPCLLVLVVLAPALDPIRYDDAGIPGRQPRLGAASVWTFEEARVDASLEARTVAFGASDVVARYEGLDPEARYAVRFTWATERDSPRTQSVRANGAEVLPPTELPQGRAETREVALPKGAAADGSIEVSFVHVSGPNAVVSEVWLLSDREQPVLSVAATGDLRGHITARCTDGLLEPVAGCLVSVVGNERALPRQATDDNGQVAWTLEDKIPSEPGAYTIVATADGVTATCELPYVDARFVRPQLTPRADDPALRQDLRDGWRFSPAPPSGWQRDESVGSDWPPIEVPGEWAMQGFSVAPGTAAGYLREFEIPAEWAGMRAKLRFDAVSSLCEVWLNGRPVAHHEGGMTPFEVDLTSNLRLEGPNRLALAVTNECLADTMGSLSQYARHQLGGITRKVTLFAVPEGHLERMHVLPELAEDRSSATLRVLARASRDGVLRVVLRGPDGQSVRTLHNRCALTDGADAELRVPVERPVLWDCERPNLYTLTAELLRDGAVVERVSRKVGIRSVRVEGNRLLVNNVAVKLHGTCRHEARLNRGRSLRPEDWARDVELLKGANVNYVRTSHYPPAEEFVALCDEAGIFVQEEGPWCWVSADNASAPEALPVLLTAHAEMLERDLSHPSVIIWDLANESPWGANFDRLLEWTRAEDPTRATVFSQGVAADSPCDIVSWHYPGLEGSARVAEAAKPWTFDEYVHLNCYNTEEISLDPGLRDWWGRAIRAMWDGMLTSPGCLGGAIWCWSDDLFEVPNVGRVGYGEWGVVDSLGRPKPEWEGVRRAYSPARVTSERLALEPGRTVVPVENRYDFTDLSALTFRWQLGERSGEGRTTAEPGETGVLLLPPATSPGEWLSLSVRDHAGREVDCYELPVGDAPPRGLPPQPTAGARVAVTLDPASGSLRAEADGAPLLLGGPYLVTSRRGTAEYAFADAPSIPAAGVSELEAEVGPAWSVEKETPFGHLRYDLEASPDGRLAVRCVLDYAGPDADIRELGLAWDLPVDSVRLVWARRGLWGQGAESGLGRLRGTATAFPLAEGEQSEAWGYEWDPRGCADFRGTKYDVTEAALSAADGREVRVLGDGETHVRALVVGDRVRLHVWSFANGGGESFLAGQVAPTVRIVRSGERLEGGCTLRLSGPLPGQG